MTKHTLDEEAARATRRRRIAEAVPDNVIMPLVADVAKRAHDDAIVIIDPTEAPTDAPDTSSTKIPDLSGALIAIVRRSVLVQALGRCDALDFRKDGHVPLVVIDRYGTSVAFLPLVAPDGPKISAPGGTA